MLKCFNLETKPNDVINLTDDIKQFVAESGIQSGECIVFNPHTTAGLTITSFWDPAGFEDLQDEIGDEGPHEVLAVAGVQEGHVQDADVPAEVLGEQPPLVLDVLVVAAQAVDAGHAEQVPGPQALHQALVLGALEILAGLAV